MIGQPPRFTLATPVFRFRALAALTARASLGGDRETVLACLQLGRLCAGLLRPYTMSRELTVERIEQTRQWVSALAVPTGIRAVAFSIFGALNGFDRSRAALALADLVKAAYGQLDEASRFELDTVRQELISSTVAHSRHTTAQQNPTPSQSSPHPHPYQG
ncbi:MAG: hypothetical protein ABIS15_00090 [Gemmatimonadaceae bacterium]